jgi:probable phosphoglycerate mutase
MTTLFAPLSAPEGTHIILVRHGQTEWNAARRVQGQTDAPLDELGRAQADRVTARLSREPIAAIHTSDLSRALDTARPLATALGIPLHTLTALREMAYGPWEGLTVAEIESRYPEQYRTWRQDRLRFRLEGVETLEALHERAVEVGQAILAGHAGQTLAVVGHGGMLRALLCALLGWPAAMGLQLRMDNASVSRVEYSAYGPSLVLFNDTSHLAVPLEEPAF